MIYLPIKIMLKVDDWQLDFNWLRVRHYMKDLSVKETLPEMNAILFLIGIQELGRVQENFSKEEKQDLMHIATCAILSKDGYFEFEGEDADGWPHYRQVRLLEVKGVEEQERLLKEKIIEYLEDRDVFEQKQNVEI